MCFPPRTHQPQVGGGGLEAFGRAERGRQKNVQKTEGWLAMQQRVLVQGPALSAPAHLTGEGPVDRGWQVCALGPLHSLGMPTSSLPDPAAQTSLQRMVVPAEANGLVAHWLLPMMDGHCFLGWSQEGALPPPSSHTSSLEDSKGRAEVGGTGQAWKKPEAPGKFCVTAPAQGGSPGSGAEVSQLLCSALTNSCRQKQPEG